MNVRCLRHHRVYARKRIGVIAPMRVDDSMVHVARQDVDFFAHRVVAIKT